MAPHEMSHASPVAPQASEPCLRRHQNTFTSIGDPGGGPRKGASVSDTPGALRAELPSGDVERQSDSEAGVRGVSVRCETKRSWVPAGKAVSVAEPGMRLPGYWLVALNRWILQYNWLSTAIVAERC
jgi:hypothetical protein